MIGGSEPGLATLTRFYTWHIFGLTTFAVILMVWHIFRVRRDGGISSQGSRGTPRISRDVLVRKEALGALIMTIMLLVLALAFPPSIGPAGDFRQLTEQATAPWFFIWVQQLLR